MSQVRPFPYHRLSKLSREQVSLLSRLATYLDSRPRFICNALEPLLGAPLSIRYREIRAAKGLPRPAMGRQLVLLEEVREGIPFVLELESPFALELVWRSLTGAVDASIAAPRHLDEVEQGVLLYLVARALWSLWGGETPVRVIDVFDGAASLGRPVAVVSMALTAGTIGGRGWLHISDGLGLPGASEKSSSLPAWELAAIPAALHVAIGRAKLSAAQWAAVGVGDVVLMDDVWARPGEAGGRFDGELRLRLSKGGPRWSAAMAAEEPASLRITKGIEEKGAVMEPSDNSTLPEEGRDTLMEIPTEISLELGRIETTAQGVLDLRPGQTLLFGRRPGDLIDLRIGPALVGRGELVDVDGELGVLVRELYSPRPRENDENQRYKLACSK